jgi:hypothetical protein
MSHDSIQIIVANVPKDTLLRHAGVALLHPDSPIIAAIVVTAAVNNPVHIKWPGQSLVATAFREGSGTGNVGGRQVPKVIHASKPGHPLGLPYVG